MRTTCIEVWQDNRREAVQFGDVEEVTAARALGPDGLQLTLIGHREDAPNQVESGIVEVADRYESLLYSEVLTVS